MTEVYSHATNDPHTAVPDWLPFAAGIGPEARNLIMASLVLEKCSGPPTRRQLALALGVDERSIYRWLKEIAAAGALSVRHLKRRRINVFHRPIPDRTITDRPITDRPITDRPIRYHDSSESHHAAPASPKTTIPDRTISDPPVVGVGDHDSLKKESPTATQREPLKTDLARWAKRFGMNAARDIDDPSLDYWTYRRFIEDKRMIGWEWRQIVSTLRDAPLDRDPLAIPLEDRAIIESARQIDEQSAQVDSTSVQLARRFEADRLEAQDRAAGRVDAKGKRI